MKTKRLILILLLVVATTFLLARSRAQATSQDQQQAAQRPAAPVNKNRGPATHVAQPQDEGDRIFQQNCSRCHTAPDGFSSRISGTALRHMRVRASLSQHDEEELMRFLNP